MLQNHSHHLHSTSILEACQLTWLVGEVGREPAENHPSHHTYQHVYCGTSRSLIVHADGACRDNGKADARSAIRVFFEATSKYNIFERFTPPGQCTNQKAELEAIARALEAVRLRVVPDRLTHIVQARGFHNPDAVRDVKHFRVIITTDSSYAVEGLCSTILGWTLNEGGDAFRNKQGKLVQNSNGFLRIKKEVELLSFVGVQVVYHLVPREENSCADALANASLDVMAAPYPLILGTILPA